MTSQAPSASLPFHRHPAVALAVLALQLMLVSTVWWETDLYRFADLGLVLLGVWVYFGRRDFVPRIGMMGWLCFAWATYVGLRYAWVMLAYPDNTGGSAEGIYIFPALYITTGYVFFLYRDNIGQLVWSFMLISLVALIASVDLGAVLKAHELARKQVAFLFHLNPIHASVGGGLIALAALCFFLHMARRRLQKRRIAWYGMGLAVAVAALALVGIMGARSKGVWIALALTGPFVVYVIYASARGRAKLHILAALCVAVLLGFVFFYERISSVVGPLVLSGAQMGRRLVGGESLWEVIVGAIESGDLPRTFEQRLQIWWNALSIWRQDWLFGQGAYWENLWRQTRYADVGFEQTHNGYLEIAMRFGLIGLLFYAVLLAWNTVQIRACARRGLVSRDLWHLHLVAMVFILATLLSNSNNRIAIGECYLMVSSSFGFCCYYLRQHADGRGGTGFRWPWRIRAAANREEAHAHRV